MAKFFKIPFAATGDILAVPDATQQDGSVSYSQGFGPDYQRKTDGTDPLAKTVPRNSTNALFNDLTGAVGEIQLNGVPAWQSVGAPYPINAIVRYSNKNWISQIADNSATPVEGASWSELPTNSYTKAQVDTKLATKANTDTTIAGYGITDAYTKAQVDTKLATKANTATTIAGYGITDAYTKAQVDTALSGKANSATTLGGYGISDAYTKTESDARYLRTSNNLSDLPNKATARTSLELGTAAQANMTTSQTDTTAGRALKPGDFGISSAIALAGGTDLNTVIQPACYAYTSGSPLVNAPASYAGTLTVEGRAEFPRQVWKPIYGLAIYVRSAKVLNPTASSADWSVWARLYSTENVSAYMQTLMPAADAAAARSTLGVVDGVGINQTIQDVTASRALATTYTNSTGKPILVWVSGTQTSTSSPGGFDATVAGSLLRGCSTYGSGQGFATSFIVPPGATYSVAFVGTSYSTLNWKEYR